MGKEETAMKGRDQEIGKEEGKGQDLDLEIEVNVREVEDPDHVKGIGDDLDQKTRRKVEEDVLKRGILVSKKNPLGKTKSMSKKNQLITCDTTLMAESMEIMMIQL